MVILEYNGDISSRACVHLIGTVMLQLTVSIALLTRRSQLVIDHNRILLALGDFQIRDSQTAFALQSTLKIDINVFY